MSEPTARFQMPELIEKGKNNTLTLEVWLDGVIIAHLLTMGSVSIYDNAGKTIVSGGIAGTPTGLSFDVPAAALEPHDYNQGWVVEWSCIIPGHGEYIFRNEAALVRRKLYPVVTDQDLFRRASSLDPNGPNPITTQTNFQDYLDEAWVTIQLRLWSAGNRPNLIMSPSSMRDCHLFLTLNLIFTDLSTRLNEAYQDIADRYQEQFEAAWTNTRFIFDVEEDGTPPDESRKGASSVFWLNGRR